MSGHSRRDPVAWSSQNALCSSAHGVAGRAQVASTHVCEAFTRRCYSYLYLGSGHALYFYYATHQHKIWTIQGNSPPVLSDAPASSGGGFTDFGCASTIAHAAHAVGRWCLWLADRPGPVAGAHL